ncbi:hypothetical protein EON63_18400 [archaeon]|nr:MAG: hypothetical protein EON63_18400 [archaeon]
MIFTIVKRSTGKLIRSSGDRRNRAWQQLDEVCREKDATGEEEWKCLCGMKMDGYTLIIACFQ